MKLILQRTSNEKSWLWGTLTAGPFYKADSLEFGDGKQLDSGVYNIELIQTENSFLKLIGIFDNITNPCSFFVKHNNEFYYDIVMRKNNNFITIGDKETSVYMQNQENRYYKLIEIIQHDIDNGIKSTLEIFDIKNMF